MLFIEVPHELFNIIFEYIDSSNRLSLSSTCKDFRYIFLKYYKPSIYTITTYCYYNSCWICDKTTTKTTWKYIMVEPTCMMHGGIKICSSTCYKKLLRHSMKQSIKCLKYIEKGPCYKYISKDKIKVKYAMLNHFKRTIRNPTTDDENYIRRCLKFIKRTDDLII
jgi:hypothetical protein